MATGIKQLNLYLRLETHRWLKNKAKEERGTMVGIVERLIRKEMEKENE